MKLITRLVVGVAALFLRPVVCCVQMAMVLALVILTLCGLLAFAVFMIDHKMAALQCAGNCIVWAALLMAANMIGLYLVRFRSAQP